MKNHRKKGFTLIELIAVIAILGILALLIVPRVSNYSTDAKVKKAQSDLTVLKNAIERYNMEHSTALSITSTIEAVKDNLTTTDADGKGPYIGSIPQEWAGIQVQTVMSVSPQDISSASFSGDAINEAGLTPAP